MDEKQDKNFPQKEHQINIELPEDKADGTYTNFVVITHSSAEFIFDFTRVVPGTPKAKVQSRIIMAPQNAKAFLKALDVNIQRYEQQHGEINVPGDNQMTGQFGFQPPDDVLPN